MGEVATDCLKSEMSREDRGLLTGWLDKNPNLSQASDGGVVATA